MALARSPEYLMPPSAMTEAPVPLAARAESINGRQIAGTPTPATMRVVQMEPGTDPDLNRIGARVDQGARVAS